MESAFIFQFVWDAPTKLKFYVRELVTDDETNTPTHLQEDTGSDSKGYLPKNITSIQILIDPSHNTQNSQNRFYKLKSKRKIHSNMNRKGAKKMCIYIRCPNLRVLPLVI